MKILEKIREIEFSDAEIARLVKCLSNRESQQFQVLTTTAPSIRDYDFWRRTQKAFQVVGFRDGHSKAIQMVLGRALDAKKLQSESPRAVWGRVWPLYHRSVTLYLQDERPGLYTLFKREDFQASPGTLTEQILRCVVKGLPLYKATVDEVREVYELWGFDRTAHVDEILGDASVEAAAIRRMIDEGIGTMRREIASAISTTRSDLLRHIDQQTTEVASLKESLRRTQDDFKSALAKVSTNLTLNGPEPKTPKPTGAGKEQRGATPVQVTVKNQDGARALAAMGELQQKVESVGRQLKELRNRFDGGLERTQIAPPPVRHSATTTARETIDKWQQVFQEVGVPSSSLGSSWILLEIIRRSRVILTDKPRLLLSLVSALPAGESRCLVASPLWTSESDWKDGLAFIKEDVGVPRFLVVTDFDVALQDVYLVPPLILWASTIDPRCANRVVLVPSDSEPSVVSPRVFELATLVTHNAEHIRDLKRLGGTIKDCPPTLELPQASASVLSYTRSQNVSSEDQLRQYAANCGVSLPPRVIENFVSLFEGLRASLSARDAGYVAQEATLVPWVERARGEAASRTLQEALRTVLDGN